MINYPGVKAGFNTLRINTSDCKDAIKQFKANGYKVLLEPTETPISINAQVLDPNGIVVTIIEFKSKENKEKEFVKE